MGIGARQHWSSRLGVILAVAGSAVGLGNFLRFPGVAAANGGGAFMIPYVVAFIVVGLPIAWVEWAMGRYAGRRGFNSAAGIYRTMSGGSTLAAYLGIIALIVPVIIYMYYLSVEAWCLGYAWEYWTGGMAETVAAAQAAKAGELGVEVAQLDPQVAKGVAVATTNSFLVNFAGIGEDFSLATDFVGRAGPFIIACFVINFLLIWRGLNKGIEWFCKWAMPALVVCALVILVRVLTLGTPDGAQTQIIYHAVDEVEGATVAGDRPHFITEAGDELVPVVTEADVGSGLGFMWNPVGHRTVRGQPVAADGTKPDPATMDPEQHVTVVTQVGFWDALGNPTTWLAAAGQIFFSLSVGLGVIVTYASYMRKDDDIALSSLTAASGNGFFEVALGGMMVIPAAFIFVNVNQIVDAGERASSLSLGFFALPGVFEHMPAGHFFAGLFFFLLFLAAVTSSLSMLQPAIAFLEEGLGIGRHASVAILGVLTAFGAGFVALVSSGLTVLDHMDFWMANFAIYILATIEVILFAWVIGIDKGLAELAKGAEIALPPGLRFMLKFVTPAFLLVVFGVWLFSQSDYFKAVGSNSTVQITVGFMLVVATFFGLLIHEAVQRWKRLEAAGELPDPTTDEELAA